MAQSGSFRWSEVSQYLDQALQLEPGKLEPWLAALEATDPELAAQLRELLALHAANRASGFMERSPLAAEIGKPRASGDARLPIGHLLGSRYRIERELGEGGMGVVYLARDEQVAGEMFAVKVLKKDLQPEALSLMREEVRKTRKLSHPNIVDVHSVNIDGQRLYVLMEYLEGKSLDALLAEEFARGMPFSHAWPIIKDVGAALGNAHDHNVIHGDLKPANLFMTTSGRTKLLDFGIARVSRGPLLQAPSGPRALTPAYASCEMLEGKEADRRDDIYSFACVIYKMLCGERPLGTVDAVEAREAGARVQPLGVLTQGQNAALARALAFDRSGRTSSVEELLEGLAAESYLILDRLWVSRHSVVVQPTGREAQQTVSPAAPTAVFNPPPHSIAVLPFVNLSGDKEQEYFSDGLTEELLNSLSRINDLQVAGRTSSFYFKGEHADLATIAHKLNVASVLEGSVRRSAHTVRVSAQLINAETGFHLWSETYDRDLGDVLKLQSDIANAVASALKITLLGDTAAKIEHGATRNPAAFDAYLRAAKTLNAFHGERDVRAAIAAYTEAIRLDPNYALAFAGRSLALSLPRYTLGGGSGREKNFAAAHTDAQRAVALAPAMAEGHVALAGFLEGTLDLTRAIAEYQRALTLEPGNARVLQVAGPFFAYMGRTDAGLAAARRAVVLDPLSPHSHFSLGWALIFSRRYQEALAVSGELVSLDPDSPRGYALRGAAYLLLGNTGRALESCAVRPDHWVNQICLALAAYRLGRHSDAETALASLKAKQGNGAAYFYAAIYAQWANTGEALDWLETAQRLRNPGLEYLKTDPLMDPLRNEPRFRAIERALNFPD